MNTLLLFLFSSIPATILAEIGVPVSAYAGRLSYVARSNVVITTEGVTRAKATSLALRSPGSAAVTLVKADGKPAARTFSNGSDLVIVLPHQERGLAKRQAVSAEEPVRYLRLSLPEAGNPVGSAGGPSPVVGNVLRRSGLVGEDFVTLLSGGDLTDSLRRRGLVSLAPAGIGTLGKVPVRYIVARLRPTRATAASSTAGSIGAGTGEIEAQTVTYAFGVRDGLLHQVRTQTRYRGNRPLVTVTETHTDIKINQPIPDSVFEFVPPPGAIEVGSLGTSLPGRAPAAAPSFGGFPPRSQAVSTESTAAPASAPTRPVARATTPASVPTAATIPTGSAPAGSSAAAALSLRVVAGMKVTEAAPGQGVCDLGAVSVLDASVVEQTFTLRNASAVPLSLVRLQASCGCLSAFVQPREEGGGKTAAAGTASIVPPGGEAQVQVRIALHTLRPGPLAKAVLVYAAPAGTGQRLAPGSVQGRILPGTMQEQPVARLEVRGTLLPAVSFSPVALEFGKVAAGQPSRSLELSATPDPRLLGAVPPLVSSHPGVTVEPLPPSPGATGGSGKPQPLRWRVNIAPDASIGPLMAVLQFAPLATAAPVTASEAPDSVTAAWRMASINLFARIEGDATAAPSVIAFPAGASGGRNSTGIVQSVALTGRTATSLEGATVTCDSPYLAARIAPVPAGSTPATAPQRALEVTLLPSTPAGVLQSRVIVTLKNGQRLVLPVSAYILPGQFAPGKTAP